MNTIQRTRNAVSAFRQPTQAFRVLALCAFLALGSLCASVHAAVPQTINYQGNLTNLGGTPISSAVVMTFRLYNVASGGAALWTETQLSVNVANGIFNTVIGSVTPIPLPFDVPYWLGVQVNAEPEMTPRQPLTSSPYAFRASSLDSAATVLGSQVSGTITNAVLPASPSLSGNLTLVNPSTASAGNIMKGANPFIHNYGVENTFIGENAGNFTLTGTDNTGLGVNALKALTSGGDNVAAGSNALALLTTGTGNVAIGWVAMSKNATDCCNTAVGNAAFANSTSGGFNVLVGAGVALGATMGDFNTIVGTNSFGSTTSAFQNTGIGGGVLESVTSGAGNTALGYGAGSNITTGDSNISIGNQGGAESGVIRIGNFLQHMTFISGIRGVTTVNVDAVPVVVDSAGQLGTVSSSRRFKDDIADMDSASHALMKLRPVTFHYKTDRSPSGRTLQYGLIAEEVAEVYPGLVAHSADGQVETVMYQFLPTMLLNEYQKQQRTIEKQATHIAKLGQDRDLQTARIADLERERQTRTAEIAGLKAAVAEIAELKQQTAHLARLLDQQRTGTVTAGLGLK